MITRNKSKTRKISRNTTEAWKRFRPDRRNRLPHLTSHPAARPRRRYNTQGCPGRGGLKPARPTLLSIKRDTRASCQTRSIASNRHVVVLSTGRNLSVFNVSPGHAYHRTCASVVDNRGKLREIKQFAATWSSLSATRVACGTHTDCCQSSYGKYNDKTQGETKPARTARVRYRRRNVITRRNVQSVLDSVPSDFFQRVYPTFFYRPRHNANVQVRFYEKFKTYIALLCI